MSPKSWFWRLTMLFILFSLTVSQLPTAFAQSEDEEPADEATIAAAAAKQGAVSPGESSSIDTGKNYVYLPMLQGDGVASEVTASATDAKWITIFYDEFCSFPSGWSNRDYNATGDNWVYKTIDGLCTVQPSRYINVMNVFMTRSFSLAGAKDANIYFRFKMQAEPFYDYFVTEYSCDGGITWQGNPSSRSNPPAGFVDRKMSLKGSSCLKKPSVTVRFGFTTDYSVTGPIAPVLDYVLVEKLQ